MGIHLSLLYNLISIQAKKIDKEKIRVPTRCILTVGTVPTGCILSVGTVPTGCILSVGTVPTGCILSDFPTPFHYLGFQLNGFLFASWKETSLINFGLHKC